MPMKCPKGQKPLYRWRKIEGGKQLLSGCSRKGKFTKVKEVKTFRHGEVTTKRLEKTKSGLFDIGLNMSGYK